MNDHPKQIESPMGSHQKSPIGQGGKYPLGLRDSCCAIRHGVEQREFEGFRSPNTGGDLPQVKRSRYDRFRRQIKATLEAFAPHGSTEDVAHLFSSKHRHKGNHRPCPGQKALSPRLGEKECFSFNLDKSERVMITTAAIEDRRGMRCLASR